MSRLHRPHTSPSDAHSGPVRIDRPGINTLDPRVREVAMKLAGGDARRIEVVHHQEAIVHHRRVV